MTNKSGRALSGATTVPFTLRILGVDMTASFLLKLKEQEDKICIHNVQHTCMDILAYSLRQLKLSLVVLFLSSVLMDMDIDL